MSMKKGGSERSNPCDRKGIKGSHMGKLGVLRVMLLDESFAQKAQL